MSKIKEKYLIVIYLNIIRQFVKVIKDKLARKQVHSYICKAKSSLHEKNDFATISKNLNKYSFENNFIGSSK